MNPFTSNHLTSVKEWGEQTLLSNITKWLDVTNPKLPYGIGDDCAIIQNQANIITTDSLIFNRHFDSNTSAKFAGAKLVKRNISDIAAMGGIPTSAVLALMLPSSTSQEWIHEFILGIKSTALEYGITIIGGDLSQTTQDLCANLTLLGYAKNPMPRKGGQVGDYIFVTGRLGGSILGQHLTFTPRLAEGRFLSEYPGIKACMDLTDGLAKDLNEFISPEMDIQINVESLPASSAAQLLSQKSGKSCVQHMFTDGEDYELIFVLDQTVEVEYFCEVFNSLFSTEITQIGKIVKQGNGNYLDIKHQLTGYEHFS
jgi:thiamine-monophosphate kinase